MCDYTRGRGCLSCCLSCCRAVSGSLLSVSGSVLGPGGGPGDISDGGGWEWPLHQIFRKKALFSSSPKDQQDTI